MIATGRRKATGSFYTPRALTEFVVRRGLAAVVQGKTPDEILALRVVDPAMGSGAFLVSACRYLAQAYEQALIEEGTVAAADLTEQDRAGFRRAVAQRCLFGVDINPMAVQLARLSMWLATLAADKPLTFLDHRLRVGHSLIGASVADVVRQPFPGRARRPRDLPLFPADDFAASMESAIGVRRQIAEGPDDSLEQVRGEGTDARGARKRRRPAGQVARGRRPVVRRLAGRGASPATAARSARCWTTCCSAAARCRRARSSRSSRTPGSVVANRAGIQLGDGVPRGVLRG